MDYRTKHLQENGTQREWEKENHMTFVSPVPGVSSFPTLQNWLKMWIVKAYVWMKASSSKFAFQKSCLNIGPNSEIWRVLTWGSENENVAFPPHAYYRSITFQYSHFVSHLTPRFLELRIQMPYFALWYSQNGVQ